MRVIIVRHHAEDSAGFIGEALQARGAELSVHLFPDDGPLPPLDGVDHVVVLGAISSVYDEVHASWIEQELDWLRHADASGVPVLGICFGAQALCTAFGGQVVAAARKEIGWTMISSVEEALVPVGPWLQFHGDRCEPPGHATILASNEIGVQAFSIGRHLAVQFHPIPTPSTRRQSRRSRPPGPVPTGWSAPRSGWPSRPRRPARWRNSSRGPSSARQ